MEDDNRPEAQVDLIPIPPLPFGVHECRGRESPSKTLTSSEPQLDAQSAMRSGTTKEHKHTQIVAECELRKDLEPLRMEQRGWTDEQK